MTSNWTHTDGNITYSVEMPEDTTLSPNETTTMKVTIKFQNETDVTGAYSGETKTLSVSINTEQDDGNGGFTPTPSGQKVYAINTNSIYKNASTLQDIGQTYNSCAETGKNVCLRYTIEDNTVTGAEVCFLKGASESCLQGWVDECLWDNNANNGEGGCTFTGIQAVYNANKIVLQSAFTENTCTDNGSFFGCGASDWFEGANSNGYVISFDGSWKCRVNSDESASCYEDVEG